MTTRKTDDPYLGVPGRSITFSPSVALVPRVTFSWDVNGYYDALGVSTDATRAQIREAYVGLRGFESDRLTYILKQLLDPEIRARYDAMPLGSHFWDRFDADESWRQTQLRLHQMAQALAPEERDEFWDIAKEVIDDITSPAYNKPKGSTPDWGYYMWRTASRDEDLMSRWMAALALELRGSVQEIAVGIMEHHGPVAVVPVGYRLVAFLGHQERPEEWADVAASMLTEHTRKRLNHA